MGVDYLPTHVNFDLIHVKPYLTGVNGKGDFMKPLETTKKLDIRLFSFIAKKYFTIINRLLNGAQCGEQLEVKIYEKNLMSNSEWNIQ